MEMVSLRIAALSAVFTLDLNRRRVNEAERVFDERDQEFENTKSVAARDARDEASRAFLIASNLRDRSIDAVKDAMDAWFREEQAKAALEDTDIPALVPVEF